MSGLKQTPTRSPFSQSFWLIWFIEFWERFAYYGVSALLTLFFVKQLGYSEADSIYTFGSFFAFVYGFTWIGGTIGDKLLGAKRTLIIGAIILAASYAGLALSTPHSVFYALAGIVVGNGLFKANPSSLISKMYHKGDSSLDSAMTMYYVAVNLGSLFSMSMTPIISERYGWSAAFWFCSIGLVLGLIIFGFFYHWLNDINTTAGSKKINWAHIALTVIGSACSIVVIAQLLPYTWICRLIVDVVSIGAFFYFLRQAFRQPPRERIRMLVAFALLLQGVVFFVLYNQMPTSLIFFAEHNIHGQILGWHIPAAEYQLLNPLIIIIASAVLAKVYIRYPATHATKFCIGMTLCATAFISISLAPLGSVHGIVSPWWMVLCYFFQSVGELFISALGLAMVAELCPRSMSGFVMGIWLLTSMVAAPLAAWVGALTSPNTNGHPLSPEQSLTLYSHVFGNLGYVVLVIAVLMWMVRPKLNRLISEKVNLSCPDKK